MNKPHEKPTVPRKCECCNADFLAFSGEVNRGAAHFCSWHCAHQPRSHATKARMQPLVDARFLKRIAKPDDPSACWLWTGVCSSKKYGIIDRDTHGEELAHRKAYRLLVGPIPNRLFVLHRCDNPPCCNPAHLFLGTNRDNMTDMALKKRSNIPAGERNPNARLTANDVLAMRERHRAGEGIRVLSRAFGINKSHAFRILSGRAWTGIQP